MRLCACAAAFNEDPLDAIRDGMRLLIAIPDRQITAFPVREPNGEWSGLDPAVVRHLAAILGVEAVFVLLPGGADAVLSAVAEDRAHLGMGRLSGRLGAARRVSLSRPYVVLRRALL